MLLLIIGATRTEKGSGILGDQLMKLVANGLLNRLGHLRRRCGAANLQCALQGGPRVPTGDAVFDRERWTGRGVKLPQSLLNLATTWTNATP